MIEPMSIKKFGYQMSVPMVDYELVEVSRTPPTSEELAKYRRAKQLLAELEETGLFYVSWDGEYEITEPRDHVEFERIPCEPRPAWGEDASIAEIVNKRLLMDYGFSPMSEAPDTMNVQREENDV